MKSTSERELEFEQGLERAIKWEGRLLRLGAHTAVLLCAVGMTWALTTFLVTWPIWAVWLVLLVWAAYMGRAIGEVEVWAARRLGLRWNRKWREGKVAIWGERDRLERAFLERYLKPGEDVWVARIGRQAHHRREIICGLVVEREDALVPEWEAIVLEEDGNEIWLGGSNTEQEAKDLLEHEMGAERGEQI